MMRAALPTVCQSTSYQYLNGYYGTINGLDLIPSTASGCSLPTPPPLPPPPPSPSVSPPPPRPLTTDTHPSPCSPESCGAQSDVSNLGFRSHWGYWIGCACSCGSCGCPGCPLEKEEEQRAELQATKRGAMILPFVQLMTPLESPAVPLIESSLFLDADAVLMAHLRTLP